MKNYLIESMNSYMRKTNSNLIESISGWNEDEYTHFTFRCQNCPALVAGDNDEWVCDEVNKPCSQVVECPEGLGILIEELKEDINTPFIKVYKEGQLAEDGWDYPLDELGYLLEEHPGESFVLKDDRLYEINEE